MIFECRRLRFCLRARDPLYWPAGKPANVLRGAFGTVLDAASRERLFAPRGAGPSGLADPPRPFRLPGRAPGRLPYTLRARRATSTCTCSTSPPKPPPRSRAPARTFAGPGFGPGRGRAELERVEALPRRTWCGSTSRSRPAPSGPLPDPHRAESRRRAGGTAGIRGAVRAPARPHRHPAGAVRLRPARDRLPRRG